MTPDDSMRHEESNGVSLRRRVVVMLQRSGELIRRRRLAPRHVNSPSRYLDLVLQFITALCGVISVLSVVTGRRDFSMLHG